MHLHILPAPTSSGQPLQTPVTDLLRKIKKIGDIPDMYLFAHRPTDKNHNRIAKHNSHRNH